MSKQILSQADKDQIDQTADRELIEVLYYNRKIAFNDFRKEICDKLTSRYQTLGNKEQKSFAEYLYDVICEYYDDGLPDANKEKADQ